MPHWRLIGGLACRLTAVPTNDFFVVPKAPQMLALCIAIGDIVGGQISDSGPAIQKRDSIMQTTA
jgi:hypothetical protein